MTKTNEKLFAQMIIEIIGSIDKSLFKIKKLSQKQIDDIYVIIKNRIKDYSSKLKDLCYFNIFKDYINKICKSNIL